ncbi:hypothetical protein [Legionella quateirensis]|uniref:Uncharacterized protein n=1 Tax=Legionella quateirensis TaxID=45072 RepID=A0A378KWE9_9GAMM|nr:hypothetical protein [Legionella quateirensis]KTD46333.1 hypothetical protein Lqua_2436 [Legionella quateirensis]STY18895.1 Uncharacterised protein [Legionella quateirensis]
MNGLEGQSGAELTVEQKHQTGVCLLALMKSPGLFFFEQRFANEMLRQVFPTPSSTSDVNITTPETKITVTDKGFRLDDGAEILWSDRDDIILTLEDSPKNPALG